MRLALSQHYHFRSECQLPRRSISIVGALPTSYEPSQFGSVAIEIQAIEKFGLPVFNPINLTSSVGVYQWVANFSVVNQDGTVIPEPVLSPRGIALTGCGQNCYVTPYCPRPSGLSSQTVLSGALFISDDATLEISTSIFGINLLSGNLELEVTLPDGLSVVDGVSVTPVPMALPLFASGLAFTGLLCWRAKRRRGAPSCCEP